MGRSSGLVTSKALKVCRVNADQWVPRGSLVVTETDCYMALAFQPSTTAKTVIFLSTLRLIAVTAPRQVASGVLVLLPTGMRTQGGAAGARAFAAGISGPSSGGVPTPSTAGLDTINGHNKPLPANTFSLIASDPKGDVMHVLVFAQAATGSWYGECVATRDANLDTAEVIAWETPLGATPPNLSFQATINASNVLELAMTSDIALTNLRGKVIYV